MQAPLANSALLPPTLAEAHAEILALRAALAEQQQLVRIPAKNPNPIYQIAADGQRLYANPVGEQLRATLSPTELAPMQRQSLEWVRSALAGGKEVRHSVSIGGRHFSVCVVPVPDGAYANLYLMDVTERVRAEQQRAAQQAFTEQVLDSLPSLVYVRDAAGRYVFTNHITRTLSEQLAVSTPTPEVAAVQAQQLALYDAADQEVLATGQERTTEDPMTLPSGEIRWLHTVKRPLTWGSGSMHVLGVSTDITELRRATEAATAAARARENFLANMSHEIRTPLNGVLGMAAQLGKTPLSEKQQSLLQIIRSSGQHLLGVVNDVLDMAKISSGKLELAQEAFNLCDSMGQAVQPLVLQAQEKGITVEGTLLRDSCPYPWVIGDAHRLNQILLNLVSNAVKFTPAGGHIHVGGYLLHDTDEELTVEFRVKDTGVGIPPDKVERIFESFTQAYADTSRHFGGTGLGLSISRALVEQMGGVLTATSEVGTGSTFAFHLTLPRAKAIVAAPAATAHDSYDTGALRGKRLLLVEDNEINRLVARMLLEGWGADVDEAEDGPTGIACVEQHYYDVVLMDIQMPGMDGLEATAVIRALPDPQRANVPILALTANAFDADAAHYLAAGMDACVSKPFEEEVLFTELTSLITRSAAE
jgi:signal transduction histidine kinase/ActR/RegA family two-component response regulator